MSGDLKGPPLQMLYELRHPDRQRVGWEDNAALMADAADRIEALEAERDAAIREMSAWAREAGEAKGRLEASEMAGVVEGWKERAEAAEAKLQMAVEGLEYYATDHAIPNEGPWGVNSTDYGNRARSTLQAIRGRHHG